MLWGAQSRVWKFEMKATWILTGVLVAGAIATPAILRVFYAEVDQVPAGTMDYWLGVPDVVKGVPVVTACNKPIYSSFSASGDTPATSRAAYQTEASVAHVTAVINGHFVFEGCTEVPDVTEGAQLICPNGDEVNITLVAGTPCNDVLIEVLSSGAN